MERTFLITEPQPGDGAWLLQQGRKKRTRCRNVQSCLLPSSVNTQGGVNGHGPAEANYSTGTFLRPNSIDVRNKFQDQGPPNSHCETFLRHDVNGKEPTTSRDSRTITTENLLSHGNQEKVFSIERQTHLHQQLPSPAHSSETNFNSIEEDEKMAANTRTKALPPHLRKKVDQSNSTAPGQQAVNNQGLPTIAEAPPIQNDNHATTPEAKAFNTEIRQRLAEDHGVNVSDPHTVKSPLVSYPSSNDEHEGPQNGAFTPNSRADESKRGNTFSRRARGGRGGRAPQDSGQTRATHSSSNDQHNHHPNGNTKPYPTESSATESKRGKPAFRGRGPRGGRQLRESRWPTTAETRPDPKRWDITWDSDERSFSSVDSVRANAGFGDDKKKSKKVEDGIDPDTGFRLTDWSGNWAPAPVDWDSRPAFRDGQSVEKIEKWLGVIELEMHRAVGKKSWAISTEDVTIDGTTYRFAPDPEKPDLCIMGDPAPRYWIPIAFGYNSNNTFPQAPQTFWNELLKSKDPKPYDESDLVGAKPWWETYQITGKDFLKHYEPPSIAGVDPDENEGERIAREHDRGSNYHTENRKQAEKAKKKAKRERRKKAQEKTLKFSQLFSEQQDQHKIKPGIKLYVRSAKPEDIPRITKIYNYYVDFTVCAPETDCRTEDNMKHRLDEVRRNLLPFLVVCERGGKVPARRKKEKGEEIILPDKVVGFAMADDYHDMRGMYRFTAEVEVFTDKDYYMKSVASCLLDKLMGLLDPHYMEKGGYEVVGEDLDGTGPQRRISNLIVHLPYDKDKPERLDWIGRWLNGSLGFEKVGDLLGIGLKDGKSVNLAMFQRKTGEHINPQLPPVMMNYPS